MLNNSPPAPVVLEEPSRTSKPFARRSYLMRDGRKLKIVLNNTSKTYELMLNKRTLADSSNFLEVDNRFKKLVRKDKGFPI